uniref:Cystatin-11-like n=1 Tax=Dermatophagoides pteronyssinus TaxID=6956 RepID=A0A6P6YBH2_DERPT|nr:cystatin-11-like [Dermatophagoides pteronyssinus]
MYTKILLYFSIYLALILAIIQAKNDTNTNIRNFSICGGWQPLNADDPMLRRTLVEVEPQISEQINSTHLFRIQIPIKAQYQLVAGTLYDTTLAMGGTNCTKSDIDNILNCKFLEGIKFIECYALIWIQPWVSFYRLMELHCDNTTDLTTK